MPSTDYNVKYARPQVLGTVNNTIYGTVIDSLSQFLVTFNQTPISFSTYTMKYEDVFTTLVYQAYGTTTLWWLVLYFNGLFSPLDLQPGMILKFPSLASITAALNTYQAQPIGQAIVI